MSVFDGRFRSFYFYHGTLEVLLMDANATTGLMAHSHAVSRQPGFRFSLENLSFLLSEILMISVYTRFNLDRKETPSMDIQVIADSFTRYGAVAIFVIVLLEYMNLPGFPAGIIMPLAGIWAARGNIHFIIALLITVAAGLVGSWILYLLGWKGGELFLNKYLKRFPKHQPAIDKNLDLIRNKGSIGIFLAKLIPMIRTLVSIPAGVLKMDFVKYTVSSTLGIFVWNLFFIGAGYFLGDTVFELLG